MSHYQKSYWIAGKAIRPSYFAITKYDVMSDEAMSHWPGKRLSDNMAFFWS
jgi:hypothetical protein